PLRGAFLGEETERWEQKGGAVHGRDTADLHVTSIISLSRPSSLLLRGCSSYSGFTRRTEPKGNLKLGRAGCPQPAGSRRGQLFLGARNLFRFKACCSRGGKSVPSPVRVRGALRTEVG